jgi:DNA-directed RNA polymerase specialized sigma subunit
MPAGISNVFLSRDDIDSFNRPPESRLEAEYAPYYDAWKQKKTRENSDALIKQITPHVENQIHSMMGNNASNYLNMRGKMLALKALDKYDPTQSSLKTYLSIQLQPLRRDAMQQTNILKVPQNILRDAGRLESSELELEDELGRPPTSIELADRMGVSLKKIDRMRKATQSYNTGSFLGNNETDSHSPLISATMNDKYRHDFVMSALRNDPINQFIYETDNGLNGRKPLNVVAMAKKLKVSPGLISQWRAKINEIANTAERKIYGR